MCRKSSVHHRSYFIVLYMSRKKKKKKNIHKEIKIKIKKTSRSFFHFTFHFYLGYFNRDASNIVKFILGAN